MRFIAKERNPASLEKWKVKRITACQKCNYSNLDAAVLSDIRNQLLIEQKHLCCYCQQRITANNSTIEHFLPQKKFDLHQVEYLNLHLACNYSRGIKKENAYCDVKKGDDIIVNILLHPDCESYFYYSKNGEIFPDCNVKCISFKEFKENKLSEFDDKTLSIIQLISVLNLNAPELISKRKSHINTIFDNIDIFDTKEKIEQYLTKENMKDKSSPFSSITKFFLQKQLHLITRKP